MIYMGLNESRVSIWYLSLPTREKYDTMMNGPLEIAVNETIYILLILEAKDHNYDYLKMMKNTFTGIKT